jgi:hypothetical protein
VSVLRTVAVHPPAALDHRPGLFAALREAFPTICFEGRAAAELGGLAAMVELGGQRVAVAAAAAGTPALALLESEAEPTGTAAVEFGDSGTLDRRLRGQTLSDRHIAETAQLALTAGDETIARGAAGPLWTRNGNLDVAALAPAELADEEPLRLRLRAGRCLALLPLIELLRRLDGTGGWQPPPLRAVFLLDDPNLHWPSYGFVKLRELADHGERHGYHLALAMVPLDAWFAHPQAASLLRQRRSLSLLVHGNDHLAQELGRGGDEDALALAAQARRRVAGFEDRYGVAVSPVMAPPHEACSEAVAAALPRTGFEAITMTRPFPWLATGPGQWLAATEECGRLTGWRPADLTPAGLPVMLRHPLAGSGYSPSEVVLRAYLDQPLILYGHQNDLADGLEVLAQRTAEVAELGTARWSSLGELAAGSFERRREGELLYVRPYGRRIDLEVPADVAAVVVERPPGSRAEDSVVTPTGLAGFGERFAVDSGRRLELRLLSADAVSPTAVPTPRRRLWPVARRIAAEARDRVAPVERLVSSRR